MDPPPLVLLAADLEDLIFPAVVILFLLISALGQVLAKIRETQRVEDARRRGPAARPGGARPGGSPPGQGALRREVGGLQREGGRPGAAGGARPAQQKGATPPGRPGGRPAAPEQRRGPPPVQAEPVVPVVVVDDAGVTEHVRSHVPAHELGAMRSGRAPHRTEPDDVMRDHLHDVFDHGLGMLGAVPGGSAEGAQAEEAEAPDDRVRSVPGAAAAGLAALLADAATLRQAIVLNEIFQRPEHRWR